MVVNWKGSKGGNPTLRDQRRHARIGIAGGGETVDPQLTGPRREHERTPASLGNVLRHKFLPGGEGTPSPGRPRGSRARPLAAHDRSAGGHEAEAAQYGPSLPLQRKRGTPM